MKPYQSKVIKDIMIQKFKKKVQNFKICTETVLLVSTFITFA